MRSDAVILDGYVDEPACFGVPPYISPYIRYCAGVLAEHGHRVRYTTIDAVRADPAILQTFSDAAVLLLIAGITVPGKYLGGTPASLTEISQIGMQVRGPLKVLGGPIGFGYSPAGGKKAIRAAAAGFDHLLHGSPAASLDSLLSGGEPAVRGDYVDIDRWSVLGAGVIAHHPLYPRVMIELETAQGCSRSVGGGCSFCTEPFYGAPRYRSLSGIAAEVEALHTAGARHFRLGRQPDLLAYGTGGSAEFPKPRPDLLQDLFTRIRKAAPDLLTLQIDNINPGTIARHQEESREALAAIVEGHTPGDVAAFGMETADPEVIRANNLKAQPEEVRRAIEIVNEVGGRRHDGIPHLLPGLNFVCGLAGETGETYEHNRRFLQGVLDAGLLVRRVNIRQLMPFEGTQAYEENTLGQHDAAFRRFKEWTRTHFDLPMLRKVFPAGTLLRDVGVEVGGRTSFGRQMGSYPILVGLPLDIPVGTPLDAVVVGHGMRSVTALPVPVRINTLPVSALRQIPGVGKKVLPRLIARRPFRGVAEFQALVGETPVEPYLTFD
ncbi:radical SAM protein [Methanofollis fontis]|uniref:Radical SAM protein n=1 Tax=Methanofollis fontis TaxID=2052832 RepID=A0A483CSK9_9EURY|nr:radical SAM protein [Methanofollis fontis]TAJ43457.1 radical SAM protein [Methanofollis fontis]